MYTQQSAKSRRNFLLRFEPLEERALLSAVAPLTSASPLPAFESPAAVTACMVSDLPFNTSQADVPSDKTDAEILAEQNAVSTGIITVTTLEDSAELNVSDGKITLREAVSYAGTDHFGVDIKFGVSGTIRLSAPIDIENNLKISGAITITSSASRCFNIFQCLVQMNDITITGASSNVAGGIYNYGNLTLINCIVSKCSSTSQGGAIVNNGGTLTLIDCDVTENIASSTGGGIYNSGTLTMDHSNVSYNISSSHGGGILNTGKFQSFNNSTISGNVGGSASSGGGILNSGRAFIENTVISKNGGVQNGGGLANGSGTMYLKSCTIEENILALHSSLNYETSTSGGGIFSSYGTVVVTDSLVRSNKADIGGGIGSSYVDVSSSQTILNNTTVTKNYASQTGGGVSSVFLKNVLIDSVITSNTSGFMAGGVYDQASSCWTYSVGTTTISNNSADYMANFYSALGMTSPNTSYPANWNASVLNHPAIIQGIIEPFRPLFPKELITIDAAKSINAAAYYWDLDGDGDYDDAEGETIALGGLGYDGEGISWETLQSLGWALGTSKTVSLKTVVAGSNKDETDGMKSSTTQVVINVEGVYTYPDAAPERLAKDLAYRDWTEGQVFDCGDDGIYVAAKVFDYNATSGFYAVGLTRTDGSDPILVLRGTEKNLTDFVTDFDDGGVGYTQYILHKSEVFAWLNSVSANGNKATLVGHSLGGALAQSFAAGYTDTENGGSLKAVYTFNSPGIS